MNATPIETATKSLPDNAGCPARAETWRPGRSTRREEATHGDRLASGASTGAHYARCVERAIAGYHRDDEGDWVAELLCGHNQHVRHRPPFQLRAWVLEAEGRMDRVGTPLDCPLCDRAELPEALRLVRSSPEWDENTMPRGLLRAHRVASGTWGRIVVHEGQLRFVASTEPVLKVVLGPGSTQAIPPNVEHEGRPLGPVRFAIEFFAVGEPEPADAIHAGPGALPGRAAADQGGDPACWAGLLCPECGAVLDGGRHRQGGPVPGRG